MSLWWARKEQLDAEQLRLIEDPKLLERRLILGPPGSGKSNILLRRAQFVRSQGMPNVLVLTFTRPLTEFLKTGCFDAVGREIFPRSCVSTLESWQREMHRAAGVTLPPASADLIAAKRALAASSLRISSQLYKPRFDAIFIDEAQDLLTEEVALIAHWSKVLVFAGDDRQRLYSGAEGLSAVRQLPERPLEKMLPFHYRIGDAICKVADKILVPEGGRSLLSTSHYNGPTSSVVYQRHKLSKEQQLAAAIATIKSQVRVYADLITQGDRIGVIVPRQIDRELALAALTADPLLARQCKILRSRETGEQDYDPSFDEAAPVCIVTSKGCKGLEFRTVHWLFCDDLAHHQRPEDYYTVVTRAKTRIDIYYTGELPQTLALAHSESSDVW